MAPLGLLLTTAVLLPGQAPAAELHQDFRGAKLPFGWLKLVGPEASLHVRPEPEGLRSKPPPSGKQSKGWGVGTPPDKVSLTGDFEITAEYELLAADPLPTANPGAGVAISVAPDGQRKKFAKVGRFYRPKEGSVFLAEAMVQGEPKAYRFKSLPTESRGGRLKLTRTGGTLRSSVADGADEEFRLVDEFEYGADPVGEVFFIANNNQNATAVDARLISLTIRAGNAVALAPNLATDGGLGRGVRIMLAVLTGATVLIALGVIIWAALRRRRKSSA